MLPLLVSVLPVTEAFTLLPIWFTAIFPARAALPATAAPTPMDVMAESPVACTVVCLSLTVLPLRVAVVS